MTSTCRKCGKAMDWARTELGKPMPLDLEPHPNGNVVIASVDRYSVPTVHVLNKYEMATDTRQRRFAHAATCGKPWPEITPLPPVPPMQDTLVLE